ncbi:MAG: hypothetical protein ACOX5R_14655 [bacterium]|jgi:hypothetical protein
MIYYELMNYQQEDIQSLYSSDLKYLSEYLPDLYYINKYTARIFTRKLREVYAPRKEQK